MRSIHEGNAREVDMERYLKKAQETVAVSGSLEKTLPDNVESVMEAFSSFCEKHANQRADLDEMTGYV